MREIFAHHSVDWDGETKSGLITCMGKLMQRIPAIDELFFSVHLQWIDGEGRMAYILSASYSWRHI